MTINLLYIFLLATFSVIVVRFEPLMKIKEVIGVLHSKNIFVQLLHKITSCSRCFGLWFALIYLLILNHWNLTFELIFYTTAVSFLSELLSLAWNKLKN